MPTRTGHHLASTGALQALSHAIEATADGADGTVVLALFQRARYFEHERRRFEALAERGAVVAVGFAGEPVTPPRGVAVVRLDADHPMAAEWTVVVVCPQHAAALRAVERPVVDASGRHRAFDARWTFERRDAVREARRLLPLVAPRLTPAAAVTAEQTIERAHGAPLTPEERQLARTAATVVEHLLHRGGTPM